MVEGTQSTYESTNINSLWLNNIYENIKNIEIMQRYAYNGCRDLMEYLQIPPQIQQSMMADVQYKNLTMIIHELELLLGDLTPVINKQKLEKYREDLSKIKRYLGNREMFISESYSEVKGRITSSQTTNLFKDTLIFISKMRNDIISEISHLLYVKSSDDKNVMRQLR